MFTWIDNLIPWLGSMTALGGDVFILILIMAALLWALVFERIFYLWFQFPRVADKAKALWEQRSDHSSWFAQHFRERLLCHIRWGLQRNVSLIRVLIALCPLLGLLGTVLGMLEVFDGMAATGNNNPRSTAAGVSKATVTTMAGMVVAISGLLVVILLDRRIQHEKNKIMQLLKFTSQ